MQGTTSQLSGAVQGVATGGSVPATSVGTALSQATGGPPIDPNAVSIPLLPRRNAAEGSHHMQLSCI